MAKSTKKRLGRPPGRKAPHRPVLSTSARVSEELYAEVTQAAQKAGRTISEEVVWRTGNSFEWEKAHGDIRALMAQAERVAAEDLPARLRATGYQCVRGVGGAAWFEPGVNAAAWVVNNLNKDVIEEMLERAAVRALERTGRGS
jgi:hypothetical protein